MSLRFGLESFVGDLILVVVKFFLLGLVWIVLFFGLIKVLRGILIFCGYCILEGGFFFCMFCKLFFWFIKFNRREDLVFGINEYRLLMLRFDLFLFFFRVDFFRDGLLFYCIWMVWEVDV